ncbi:Protein of unknown function [Cotesia congregata]|uniref:Uncharacterized protein n=1 Tax=Cotesia congregata TaxID=51543 RepID=A0A8J2HJT1_COTCN|nr:Protein of unknown function [Cotesia congregata]
MYKEAIICLVGTFCILQIVDSHPSIASTSFDAKKGNQDIKYTVYPESHGDSKFCFKLSKMADKSYMPSVELIIHSLLPFNQTERSSEILVQKESFLFIVEPSLSENAREALRLLQLSSNFFIFYVFLFLATINMVGFFILYCVSNLHYFYIWKFINKTSQNLKESYKEKIKLVLCWLLSTASWILLVFITYTMCNLIYFGKFDFFYEQNVRFDVDQESTLCLTPQQFAEKLATILSEKRINGAANFNQSDEFVQDSQQEEQNIMIIRYWDSFSIFDSNFWIKLIVYLLFSGEYVLLKIFIVIPTLIVMTIALMIYYTKVMVKSIYMLLNRIFDLKKELDSKVIVTPVLTLESNLKGSVTLELCTEKK